MFAGLTCVAAVAIAVFAVPSTKERRSYSEGVYWSAEDASVAGDSFLDCSDDDSDSVELAYIINKREAPMDRPPRDSPSQPRGRPRLRLLHKRREPIMQP